MKNQISIWPARHPKIFARGTAMIETALVLPVILFILAMLLYFGRGMVRVQRAQVMDRYESWRQVSPTRYVHPRQENDIGTDSGVNLGPSAAVEDANHTLNEAFFGGHAQAIDGYTGRAFPREAADQLINAAAGYSGDTGLLVQQVMEILPHGESAGFATSHTGAVRPWAQVQGPISHSHTRLSNDWCLVNGWRVLALDWNAVQSWGYNQMMPQYDSEPDPQRKIMLRLSNVALGRQRNIEAAGSGGGVLPRDAGYVLWQHKGAPVGHSYAVRNAFFQNFDSALAPMAEQNNPLASGMRNAYLAEPYYLGPTVE